jgi:hypothetical protein
MNTWEEWEIFNKRLEDKLKRKHGVFIPRPLVYLPLSMTPNEVGRYIKTMYKHWPCISFRKVKVSGRGDVIERMSTGSENEG